LEDKILKAIEDLRKDMNLKFENQGTQLKENTQILKALEHQARWYQGIGTWVFLLGSTRLNAQAR